MINHMVSSEMIMPIGEVAQICGIAVKHSTFKTERRARCPFCGTGKGKMTASINEVKNLFYCHRCGEGHNSISLYSKITGISTGQAFRELLDNAA